MSNYPPRLARDDIKYIALEGGGGKGNAFVGALESLAHPDINVIRNSGYRLTNIEGVAGASAGAITALFLAAGFTPFELKTITELEDFNAFFDGPAPGRVFRIGGFRNLPPRADPVSVELSGFVREAMALVRDADPRRMAAYVATHVRIREFTRALQELHDRLTSIPDSPADALESALRIRELIESLTRLEVDDTLAAVAAVREILTAVPPALWNHVARMGSHFYNLVRWRIHEAVVSLLFMHVSNFMSIARSQLPDETYRQLLNRDAQATADAIVHDFGVLTGEAIYDFFRRWLAVARLRVTNPSHYEGYVPAGTSQEELPGRFQALKDLVVAGTDPVLRGFRDDNMTFEVFEREFRMKMAFTGTNLESLTSHVFSGATTPRFYIVDAVRLSMALPYCIFKPLIIREDDPLLDQVLGPGESPRERDPVSLNTERHPLIGVWVDGGLFNNMPSHVFDREPGGGETLSLRLDSSFQMMPESVTNIAEYFQRFPGGVFFGTGEALAARSYENKYRAIALDTGDLTLLSFSPSPAQAGRVRRSAIEYVFRYFDFSVPSDL
ncbi:MAG TPA: patatin-like phospholipase family protein [Fibrobacteria bacterium]|nr:patatin-like phospholipase family protein [Fibrobacteria bacterium]